MSKGEEVRKEKEDDEEECESFFSVGHEYTPDDMKTTMERNALRKAWFSDISEEHHDDRIDEEREFLIHNVDHKNKLVRVPKNSYFKEPTRTIPVSVGPFLSAAIEFVHQNDFDELNLAERLHKEEVDQLVHYFLERLARCRTVKHIRNVGGELNTRVKTETDERIQKVLLDQVLPRIVERLKEEKKPEDDS